jgi:hypothetical protein
MAFNPVYVNTTLVTGECDCLMLCGEVERIIFNLYRLMRYFAYG